MRDGLSAYPDPAPTDPTRPGTHRPGTDLAAARPLALAEGGGGSMLAGGP